MILRRLFGSVLSLGGLAILVALHVAIYDHRASAVLVDLGIPGALLSTLAGLTLAFGGGALALGRRETAVVLRPERWRSRS